MFKKIYIYLILFVLCLAQLCVAFEKIIPMAPNLVETVYSLGQGEKVCAVPMFTVFPEEALKKPVAGSYLSPSYETILKLDPDLIIIQGKFEKLDRFVKKYKISVLSVNMDSIDSIYSGIEKISRKLGCIENGEALVKKIEKEISGKTLKGKRPEVFICLGRIPNTLKQISTPGKKSFISELIYRSGGKNIFSDLDKNYLVVSKEEVLRRNPDIIIDMMPGYNPDELQRKNIKNLWKKLGPVKALKAGNIFILNEDFILIPGPRIVETSKLFNSIFRKSQIVQ